jgi:hypothetical protein
VVKAGKTTGDPRVSSILVTDGQTAGETQMTDHTDDTRLNRNRQTTVTLSEGRSRTLLRERDVIAQGRRDGVHNAFIEGIRLQHGPL